MLKGRKCEMSLKGGDAQQGELVTKYDGGRPTHADYNPMRKQGGLVLGTVSRHDIISLASVQHSCQDAIDIVDKLYSQGGDNSDRAMGIFCKLLQQ